jgi:ring-1,2-phenylacetyl-CoA epoxidase subunit PaaE
MQNSVSVKISAKIEETSDACTFELQSETGEAIAYEAGQFITFIFKTKLVEKRRSYSFSSAPFENTVRITVKRVANGEFSRPLVDSFNVGDTLLTAGVAGQFTASSARDAEQVIFLAAGSGITPCFSMIKELLHNTSKQLCLYYSNRTLADIIFKNELDGLQARFPQRLLLRYFTSDAASIFERRISHYLLPQLLQKDIKVADDKVMCYLCGPYEYMQMAEIALRSRFKAEQIRKEQFDSTPRKISMVPPDKTKHLVHLRWQGKSYALEAGYPTTVLNAALRAGLSLPYSCSAGRCGACIASCTKGKVWMGYNEVLTDKEVESGRFLTCQAYPQGGDIWLEIE